MFWKKCLIDQILSRLSTLENREIYVRTVLEPSVEDKMESSYQLELTRQRLDACEYSLALEQENHDKTKKELSALKFFQLFPVSCMVQYPSKRSEPVITVEQVIIKGRKTEVHLKVNGETKIYVE